MKPLTQLKVDDYAALIFPGGYAMLLDSTEAYLLFIFCLIIRFSNRYGAAKNLCTFAKDAENCSVEPDVERCVYIGIRGIVVLISPSSE